MDVISNWNVCRGFNINTMNQGAIFQKQMFQPRLIFTMIYLLNCHGFHPYLCLLIKKQRTYDANKAYGQNVSKKCLNQILNRGSFTITGYAFAPSFKNEYSYQHFIQISINIQFITKTSQFSNESNSESFLLIQSLRLPKTSPSIPALGQPCTLHFLSSCALNLIDWKCDNVNPKQAIMMAISDNPTLLSALLLLLALLTPTRQQQYSLSPPLPPTAFVDQYYSCAFRVGGLSKPRFSFSRLPPPLVGSKSGIVWGIPSASGAYRATVTYWQEEEEDQESRQEVMFIVTLPEYNTTEVRSRNITQPVPWAPGYLQTVYRYGGVIDLNLAKVAGKKQYNWTYLHLPSQLHGDISGRINGVINQTGYFTFAAICADDQGYTLDYFITLNIQPLSYDLGTKHNVQVQNLFPYDLGLVDAVNRDATENAHVKMREYRKASEQLDRARKYVRICKDSQEKAKTQAGVVGQIVKIATKQLAKQLQLQNSASNRLKDAKGVFQLKKVAYSQAEMNTKSAQLLFDSANSTFLQSKRVLSQTSSLFINAQTQSSQAASLLSTQQLTQQLALQDVNSTFQSVMQAKQLLQNYTIPASILGFNVSSAKSEREVASFQNDAAISSLNTADSNVKKVLQQLQTAKNEVYILKQELSSAKSSLGQAQFNLTQMMNNLFVAQAAKEQADKQLLLASAQSVQLASLTFAGCNQGNYPSMFGTATILVAGNSAFKLDSGYSVLIGGCTTKRKGDYTNGTVIVFEGYLKGGAIHAIRLSNG